MIEFIYSLASFLTNFFTEIMAVQLLFCILFARRKYWHIALPLWIASDAALFFIPNFYSLDGFLAVGGWFNLSFAVALVISSLFFFATVKLKIKDILFYSSAAYAVQNFSHNVSYVVNDLFGMNFRVGFWFLIALAVFALALTGVYFLIVRRIKTGELRAVDNLSILVISVVTISLTYIFSMRFLPITSSDNIARFYAAGCCLFLLFMQFSIFDRGRVKTEKETIENLLYTQRKQYNVWKENVDIINVKCHDLKHRIYMARKTDDGEERSASLKEVENAIMIYDNFAKTGNETLDIILTEKSLLCERKNIKFSYMIDGEKLSFISDEDLCSLFCNMLDNAIESASQVENEEKRIISLNASLCGNMLTVHQDNTHIGNVNMVDGIPKTTKSDERFHGFGIKSMQMIVDKYRGTIRFEVSEDKFCLDILFLI